MLLTDLLFFGGKTVRYLIDCQQNLDLLLHNIKTD